MPPGIVVLVVVCQQGNVGQPPVVQIKGHKIRSVMIVVAFQRICGYQHIFVQAPAQKVTVCCCRVIPGAVHLIPLPVQFHHVPGVIQCAAGHQHGGNVQAVQRQRIDLGVALADRGTIDQGVAGVVIIDQTVLHMLGIIGKVLHQPVVNIDGLFQIALTAGVCGCGQLGQTLLHNDDVLIGAVSKIDGSGYLGGSVVGKADLLEGISLTDLTAKIVEQRLDLCFVKVQVGDIRFGTPPLYCFFTPCQKLLHGGHGVPVILCRKSGDRSHLVAGRQNLFPAAIFIRYEAFCGGGQGQQQQQPCSQIKSGTFQQNSSSKVLAPSLSSQILKSKAVNFFRIFARKSGARGHHLVYNK